MPVPLTLLKPPCPRVHNQTTSPARISDHSRWIAELSSASRGGGPEPPTGDQVRAAVRGRGNGGPDVQTPRYESGQMSLTCGFGRDTRFYEASVEPEFVIDRKAT